MWLEIQTIRRNICLGSVLMKDRLWKNHENFCHQRLALETREMKKSFPQFRFHRCKKKMNFHRWKVATPDELFWRGKVKTHSGNEYTIVVVYPKDYPFGEIRAYVESPYIPATDHRFQDGRLCLYGHEGKGEGYEKGKTSAVTVVAWVAAWLHAYEIWSLTGQWPFWEEKK